MRNLTKLFSALAISGIGMAFICAVIYIAYLSGGYP